MNGIESNPHYHGFWGTADVFSYVGYKITFYTASCEEMLPLWDFLAEKDGKKYAIDVKIGRERIANKRAILSAAETMTSCVASEEDYTPVVVVLNVITSKLREYLATHYPKLIVIDIQNLLYMVQENDELRNKMVSHLHYSVEELLPDKPELDLTVTSAPKSIWDEYIILLKEWNPVRKKDKEFETVCTAILKDLFADELNILREQQTSNAGLFRFDAIAKIKQGNSREFWEMAERYFSSKYIIFEYKNYSKKITQGQVYTTVKYLYAKALRSIAILISAKGTDTNADKAIRGILREEGKLIIALSNDDLIKMLEMKKRSQEPADYLSTKLDELMITLEK